MSAATGLGPLECAALAAVGRRRRPTTAVLADLEDQGIAPAYARRVVEDLVAPWRRHLPLLDGEGNWGSEAGDPPADPRYTAVALTEAGRLALEAEEGTVGPVPLGLVDGTLYAGGRVPPFDPLRVLTALQDGTGDAGPPALPTGGEVGGEVAQLLAGEQARLQLGPRVVREPGALVLVGLPLSVGQDEVTSCLLQRVRTHGRHVADYQPAQDVPPAPVVDVLAESTWRLGTRVVCRLAAGADAVDAEQWVRGVWPVTVEVDCRLPAPAPERLLGWQRGDGEGLRRLGSLLLG